MLHSSERSSDRVQRSSDKVQRSSLGFSVAQQGATWISKVQCRSAGCSLAQEGAAQLSRVQHSSVGCSRAWNGAAQHFRMERNLERCGGWGEGRGILYIKDLVVQWKDIRPWRPEFGPERKHLVAGNSFVFIFGGWIKSSEAAMGGGRFVHGVLMSPKRRVKTLRLEGLTKKMLFFSILVYKFIFDHITCLRIF